MSTASTSSTSNKPPPPQFPVPQDPEQEKGFRVLNGCYYCGKIMAIASLALFAVTIVFLILATAQKMHPLMPVYALSGCVFSIILLAIQDCCQTRMAKSYNVSEEVQKQYIEARIDRKPP